MYNISFKWSHNCKSMSCWFTWGGLRNWPLVDLFLEKSTKFLEWRRISPPCGLLLKCFNFWCLASALSITVNWHLSINLGTSCCWRPTKPVLIMGTFHPPFLCLGSVSLGRHLWSVWLCVDCCRVSRIRHNPDGQRFSVKLQRWSNWTPLKYLRTQLN